LTRGERSVVTWAEWLGATKGDLDLRLDLGLWQSIVEWVFDFDSGEQAGALLIRTDAVRDGAVVVGERFFPVTEEYVLDRTHGLRFDGRFNLRVAEAAERAGCGAILIHAHPLENPPLPSSEDATFGVDFLAFMRRRRPNDVHGLLVVGEESVTGVCETPAERRAVRRLTVGGIPTLSLPHEPWGDPVADARDRQFLAIGPAGQQALAHATVAVIGVSGGGSHVAQQLIHAGVGTLIPVDPDIVDERNLRRVVGAIRDDIGRTKKVGIPVRLAEAVRPEVEVNPIDDGFPSTETIRQLRFADVLVGCVDGWDVRDAINEFALQYRIPYVDIGASITPPSDRQGLRLNGQVAIVAPDGPCLRCMGLVTDGRVAASREQRQGYAEGVDEPQVVSLNGTLASEAVTAVIMLIAGDDRLARYRRYEYPPGKLIVVEAERRIDCPACRAARLVE
jgi:molybdopterin/thiamine biosynthesis adenylyltransferase